MLSAIVTKLKTGTYKSVHIRNDGETNLTAPYVMIWENTVVQTGDGQGVGGVFVSLHMVPGQQDSIDEYMKNDLITLLHDVILTDAFSNSFRLQDSNDLSVLVSNDDNSISRDRLFLLPILGAV